MNALTRRLMTVALVGSVALAGCGDDDDGSDDATGFCDAVTRFETASAANPATTGADELAAQYGELTTTLDDMRSTAPEEIEGDVEVVASTLEEFVAAFAEQDYDYAAMIADPDGLAAVDGLNTEEFGTATGNVLAYARAQCGVDTSTTSPVGIANPASEFCVEQGGTVEIVDEAGGQVGYCNLPDGTRVEEWEYFRQETGSTQP